MENKDILLIILAVITIYYLLNKREGMETGDTIPIASDMPQITPPFVSEPVMGPAVVIEAPAGPEPNSSPNNFGSLIDDSTLNVNMNDPINNKYAQQAPESRPKLSATDLLPGYSQDAWFDNPDVGVKVEDANLMADALAKIGVDTIGTTLKNATYDIRGNIPCPKFNVGPFNNSTVEPDINIKRFY